MDTATLITSLTSQAREIKSFAQLLTELNAGQLTWRQHTDSWNILECIQHLNLYGDFYLPEFKKRIGKAHKKNDAVFKPGPLGNYFANSMLPGVKMKKMKTFKDKNPLNAQLDKQAINRFINQQDQLLELLEKSETISLNKTKISISITKLLKLKLGDGFRFYINHMQRHMQQIRNIQQQQKANVPLAEKPAL